MQVEDWRLHDAMCSSSGGANNAPQFAGTTELEDPGARLIRIRLNRTRRVQEVVPYTQFIHLFQTVSRAGQTHKE